MDAPLYDELIKYSEKMTSFHMPGHKFGNILDMKDIGLLQLDLTEVPGLDNLYEASGVISKAQKKMAKTYKAKESIFITNGSTSGILASILSVCKPGDSLIVARNCHHSVWNALILGGIKPIYINPAYNKEYNILGGICPDQVKQTLIENPQAKGAIIVSPTYEGLISDVGSIAKVVHTYNKVLIVDEAHGAHFAWHEKFPLSAVQKGADLIVQSMHKTLPAITQSALLHIGSNRVDKSTVIQRLQMVQTSSPSYIMMALMDYMRSQMEKEIHLWENYVQEVLKAREELTKLNHLLLLEGDICAEANIYDLDISKLVIFTHGTNITGIELSEMLRSKYKIQVEVETDHYIIAMSTVADGSGDLELFSRALLEIDRSLEQKIKKQKDYQIMSEDHKSSMMPRKIYFASKEDVQLESSVGRISGTNIMLFPPGIPLVCIGEVLSKGMVKRIKDSADQILGITKEKGNIMVSVLKEEESNEG